MNDVMIINNVKGFLNSNGSVNLNLEDVARGLGFTFVARSGNEVVRWNTVRKYLNELGVANSCNDENKGKEGLPEYIPENIFYKLCFKSRSETAKKFQEFVTDEVLPSIRKNGGYIMNQDKLTDSELLSKAILIANTTIQKRNEQLEEAKKLIEKNKAKVLFADSLSTKGTILIREMAKILTQIGINMGEKRLFEWLRENGFLIKKSGNDYNSPTQKSIEMGIMKVTKTTIETADGRKLIRNTPRITGKGQVYFVDKFSKIM